MNQKYCLTVLLLLLTFQLVAKDVKVFNCGVPGNNTKEICARVESEVLSKEPDLVLLMGGSNDFLNSNKFTSFEEAYKNMEAIVDQLLEKKIDVILITPPTVDVTYLYSRHDVSKFIIDPVDKLQFWSKLMKKLAIEKNIIIVDFHNYLENRGIPIHNQDDIIVNEKNMGIKDGLHLTQKGYKLLADFIYMHIPHAYKTKNAVKIVCLGDSLTCGVFMEGAGTAVGDTYPSYLRQLFEK